MFLKKCKLRNVVAIAICLTAISVFSSCEKVIDHNKLEGTVWKAETDEGIFNLRFVDETNCTLGTGRKDGTFSANLTTYFWSYGSDYDSRWGLFFLNELNAEGEIVLPPTYSGTIENKELYLYGSSPESHGFEVRFKRVK